MAPTKRTTKRPDSSCFENCSNRRSDQVTTLHSTPPSPESIRGEAKTFPLDMGGPVVRQALDVLDDSAIKESVAATMERHGEISSLEWLERLSRGRGICGLPKGARRASGIVRQHEKKGASEGL